MSEAKELLGRWVYYFDDPRVHMIDPIPAQIVGLMEPGVHLWIPRPDTNRYEFKNFIEWDDNPRAYHWIEIEEFEQWKEYYFDV